MYKIAVMGDIVGLPRLVILGVEQGRHVEDAADIQAVAGTSGESPQAVFDSGPPVGGQVRQERSGLVMQSGQ